MLTVDTPKVKLVGSQEMDACREALIEAGVDQDTPLVVDLERCAIRAEIGTFDKPFAVPQQEASLVISALRDKLIKTSFEEQPASVPRRILSQIVYVAEVA